MSKSKAFTRGRKDARKAVDSHGELAPTKMLGKLARYRYRSGPSRLNRNEIARAFADA